MPEPIAGEGTSWIWLEVAEVLLETSETGSVCFVLLKADREHPKPLRWRVLHTAAAATDDPECYRRILNELDKKRTVLARLSSGERVTLQCTALRFQSADLGNR